MFFEFWKWICSAEIKGFSLKKCSIKGLICFPFPRIWNFDALWKTISSITKLLLMWILTQYFWCDNLENDKQSRKEGQSRLNILKIYSKINWSYWKSISNQSKYLGFPQNTQHFSVFFYVTPIEWLFWNIFKILQQDPWQDRPSLLRWLGEVVFWFFICLLSHRILVNSFFVCWKKLKKLCNAKIALSLHRDLKWTFSNTISSKNHVKWN